MKGVDPRYSEQTWAQRILGFAHLGIYAVPRVTFPAGSYRYTHIGSATGFPRSVLSVAPAIVESLDATTWHPFPTWSLIRQGHASMLVSRRSLARRYEGPESPCCASHGRETLAAAFTPWGELTLITTLQFAHGRTQRRPRGILTSAAAQCRSQGHFAGPLRTELTRGTELLASHPSARQSSANRQDARH